MKNLKNYQDFINESYYEDLFLLKSLAQKLFKYKDKEFDEPIKISELVKDKEFDIIKDFMEQVKFEMKEPANIFSANGMYSSDSHEKEYKGGIHIITIFGKNINYIIHELRHAFDDYRTNGKFNNSHKSSNIRWYDEKNYNNQHHEKDAKFDEIISDTDLNKDIKDIIKDIKNSYYWNKFNDDNQKRLLKRLYKIYHQFHQEKSEKN